MTKEEAKYYFQQLMNRMEGINLYKPEGGIALGAKEQLFGVFDMALEKQIPKKPLMSEMYTDYGYLTDMYSCPSCSDTLCFKGNFVHHDYCDCCGQRLNWGDEE